MLMLVIYFQIIYKFRKFKMNVNIRIRGYLQKMSAVRGEEGCPVQTFYGQEEGVLQIRTSALFGAINFELFEIYGVFARTGGGVNFFAILYGRRTAPKI